MTVSRYPRTRHLEGSAVQHGDEGLDVVAFDTLRGKPLIVSEKIDGANCGVSFSPDGRLTLQSRSRVLQLDSVDGPYGGLREWAVANEDLLWPALRDRYVMFGEWMLAKQTVFYDALPSSFLELDVLDKDTGQFLSTSRRRQLLQALPVDSAPVLAEGKFQSSSQLSLLIGPSRYKTPAWRQRLLDAIAEAEVSDGERFVRETDPSDDMEGLYIKLEQDGVVLQRAKLVRVGFCAPTLHTHSGWLSSRRVHNFVS